MKRRNPHVVDFDELARVTSPDGRCDAVLLARNGRNQELRVVRAGKEPHNAQKRVVFIHCRTHLVIEWRSSVELLVQGQFDEASPTSGLTLARRSDGALVQVRA